MNTLHEASRYVNDESSRRSIEEASDMPTERARNGQPTLTIRGFRLHSAVNPASEADDLFAEWLSEKNRVFEENHATDLTFIVFGPGLGYIIGAVERAIASRRNDGRIRIICIEADPEVARKALQLRVWEPVNASVTWLIGTEAARPVLSGIAEPYFIVAATPGYRLNKEAYESAIERFSDRSSAERPMRIVIPTPLYGGSLPVAFHCAEALQELGHQTEILDFTDYYAAFRHAETVTSDMRHSRALQNLLTTFLAETVVAKALDWRADMVWAVAQSPLTPPALQELRHEGVHTALWFVEDFRIFGYWRELAPYYDAVFTIQRGEFHDALRSIGVRNMAYLPCAANPRVHRPLDLNGDDRQRYGANIAFVGAGYYNRQKLFARLSKSDLKIWGNDWPTDSAVSHLVQEHGRRIATEETAKIYCATKVNLNLHSSPHHEDVNPHGDFVNPRTFEIAACGAFQLADYRSELPDLIQPELEIAVFRNAEELPRLIEYYLTHDDERKTLALRARDRVLREHTYGHRMESALRFCEERLPRLSQRKRGPNYISTLKKAAAGDEELIEFLSAFSDDEEVTLDQIVARIKIGNGKLSRAEGVFLLMKEFRDWGREKGVIQ